MTEPFGVSQYRVAKDVGVSPLRMSQIIRGQWAITANTVVWLRMQARSDLEIAHRELSKRIQTKIRTLNPVSE